MVTRTIHLTPPRFSPDHIKEKIICIRAHRERIFRVATESINNKLIFHNYGQGGAGWTFLFGCVNESMRQFEKLNIAKNKPILIIGAGAYGLLTAITLTRNGFTVKIIAKETDNLPSTNAAGFFFPRARKSSTDQEREVFETTGIESYTTYLEIMDGKHPFIKNGAKLLPAYYGLDIDPKFGPYIAKGLMQPPEPVTIDFGNAKQYPAMQYMTLFMDTTQLWTELQRNVRELSIFIEKKEITLFDELPESIIFNCAGLGAKKLAGDVRMVPVQGHLIALTNQADINQLQYMINVKVVQTNPDGRMRDELIYFAPKDSGILGITFIRGQDSQSANQHEFGRLLQRCQDFFGAS